METDDQCLYIWFQKLIKEMKLGTRKDVTQAKQFILKEFSSNYISVKLSNKFILDILEPIITCTILKQRSQSYLIDLKSWDIFWLHLWENS